MNLIIRADANTNIGIGHIMRCLALAQRWRDQGGEAIFIICSKSKALYQRLLNEGFQSIKLEKSYPDPEDWEKTLKVLLKFPKTWIVLDGYHFDSLYQRLIKEAGHPLLVIDDLAHIDHYYADLVLNQNIYAEQLDYSCEAYTRLLKGTLYTLLRSEFLSKQKWERKIPKIAKKVLVTLGGSDPDNHTGKVIQALQRMNMKDLNAVVVVGADNPYVQALQSEIQKSECLIRLVYNVNNKMPDLMAWADVAVTAGGTTCWEIAFMGLPALVMIIAQNQEKIGKEIEKAGFAENLGKANQLTPVRIAESLKSIIMAEEKRKAMSHCGKLLIDGKGAQRVIMEMKNKMIVLREVRESDCKLLFVWANEPDVRQVSFSSKAISWDEHMQWFKSKMNDPSCLLYLALNHDHLPLGQVRFTLNEKKDEAIISFSIDKDFRNQGYGSLMIREACKKVIQSFKIHTIHAYVKHENAVSTQTLRKVGFLLKEMKRIHGCQANHLIFQHN